MLLRPPRTFCAGLIFCAYLGKVYSGDYLLTPKTARIVHPIRMLSPDALSYSSPNRSRFSLSATVPLTSRDVVRLSHRTTMSPHDLVDAKSSHGRRHNDSRSPLCSPAR